MLYRSRVLPRSGTWRIWRRGCGNRTKHFLLPLLRKASSSDVRDRVPIQCRKRIYGALEHSFPGTARSITESGPRVTHDCEETRKVPRRHETGAVRIVDFPKMRADFMPFVVFSIGKKNMSRSIRGRRALANEPGTCRDAPKETPYSWTQPYMYIPPLGMSAIP